MKSRSLPLILALVVSCLAPSLVAAESSGRRWWSPKIRSKHTDAAKTEKIDEEKPADDAEASAEQAPPEAAPAAAAQSAPAPSVAATPPAAAAHTAAAPATGAAAAPAAAAATTQSPTAATTPPASQQQAPAQEPPPAAAAVAVTAATVAAVDKAPPPPPPPPVPDATLQKVITNLRKTPIGSEPTAVTYLDLISAGKATPEQVNDFAGYMSKRGMPKIAVAFQDYAVKLKPDDATLWMNLGTIQIAANSLGHAETSFKKSIAIDPTRALAHYNLGSVYDAQKNYDAALEEYRRALVLDPDLADPRKNPQVVNNENLLAVKLQIYQAQAGSLGLPILQMQKPAAPPPKKH